MIKGRDKEGGWGREQDRVQGEIERVCVKVLGERSQLGLGIGAKHDSDIMRDDVINGYREKRREREEWV